jgi:hypothetical protein
MTTRNPPSRKVSVRSLKVPDLQVDKKFVEELRKDGVAESFIVKISEPKPADGRG